ncbi:MAG TPA: hypothetical protein VME21_16920 [Steroidobacteraceae bacterium]|nr:hypothetical protein [Steroidobacteraceae bacterium]
MRRAAPSLALLGIGCFWGALWMAALRFPSEYDWRYMTISTLLYPDRNPHGYRWAWGGLLLCALAGLYWTGGFGLRTGPQRSTAWLRALWTLRVGYACMVLCALWPERLLGIHKGHETLALLAFIGVTLGLVQLTFRAAAQRTGRPPHSRAVPALVCAALLLPVLLAALTQAYIAYALPALPWVGLAWRARGVPMFLSFALWEWVTCVVFSACMAMLIVLL